MTVTPYTGPAMVVLSDEELLLIWQDLNRIPTARNGDIRRKIKNYLENRNQQ